MPWVQGRAGLATCDTHVTQVSRSRVRWSGRQVDSFAREVTASGWQDNGESDWLVPSLRLVGRARPDGEVISIWWSGLAGAHVDLGADTVHLDGTNGWRGHITGPGVAPIAVAAVGACHGPGALRGTRRSRPPSRADHSGWDVPSHGAARARTGRPDAQSVEERDEGPGG